MITLKKGLIIGFILIVIAITIAALIYYNILPENDLGFLFAGIGVIVIGITFLIQINKKNTREETKKIDE